MSGYGRKMSPSPKSGESNDILRPPSQDGGAWALGREKKDESIKFIVDKLKLYGYKVTCRG